MLNMVIAAQLAKKAFLVCEQDFSNFSKLERYGCNYSKYDTFSVTSSNYNSTISID
jgi:hypothetical protein